MDVDSIRLPLQRTGGGTKDCSSCANVPSSSVPNWTCDPGLTAVPSCGWQSRLRADKGGQESE